ncbi:ABC transporter permease [Vibrio diazotrophicus]|uniref:ABC transporter permease n=1 Tax=Vibrio diazotrophicus TaxID=685 RepID=UPI0005A6D43F|nr:ABC transporter permease [Vibrio diazotrophicus]
MLAAFDNKKLYSNRSRLFGVLLLCVLISMSMIGWVMNVDPAEQNLSAVLMPPGAEYWLGSDHYGRNMFARLSEALRLSLSLAIICVLSASTIGCILGVIAGWYGRWLDNGLNIIVNILLAMPGLVFVLLFAALVPGSFTAIYIAIALVQWVEYFRVSRSLTQSLANSPEIQNALLLGFGRVYIFRHHLWPTLRSPVLTMTAFGAANAVLYMASLGFVYVGIQPPTSELGQMIVELFPYYGDAPWLLLQPLTMLALIVLAFHLIAGEKR